MVDSGDIDMYNLGGTRVGRAVPHLSVPCSASSLPLLASSRALVSCVLEGPLHSQQK